MGGVSVRVNEGAGAAARVNVELRDTAGTLADTPGVNRKGPRVSKLNLVLATSRANPAANAALIRSDLGYGSQIIAAKPAAIR